MEPVALRGRATRQAAAGGCDGRPEGDGSKTARRDSSWRSMLLMWPMLCSHVSARQSVPATRRISSHAARDAPGLARRIGAY